jgi:GTP-dependent dephospho-CoA kinase
MPAGGTPSGSSDVAWVLPDELRSTFSMRYGPVLAGPEAEDRIRSLGVFASCGDMVTRQAIDLGRLPLLGIVDYRTRRNEPVDPAAFEALAVRRTVRVRNPAGMLTERLRTAVRELIHAGGGLLVVEGEEDLGALALVEEMPAGATVIYGIPGAGVSFVTVDGATKQRVRELIGRLERRSVDLGA